MKYQLKEPSVDVLKITGETITLEDGTTATDPNFATGMNYIMQTKTVISDADLAADYIPLAS